MSSIVKIVKKMDEAVTKYKKRNEILEHEIGYKNGHLKDSRRYQEFKWRKEHIYNEYDEECLELRDELARAKEAYGKLQNNTQYMPTEICLGSGRLQYPGLDEKIPLVQSFPLQHAGYVITQDKDILVYQMYRLLRSLPKGKCAFYVYDPIGLGSSLAPLRKLFNCPEVFPNNKFYGRGEIDELLHTLQEEAAKVQQQILPTYDDCPDWWSYNQKIKIQQENPRKLLPYRIAVFFDLPQGTHQDSLNEIKILAEAGQVSGVYCMFSCQEHLDETSFDNTAAALEKLKKASVLISDSENIGNISLRNLSIMRKQDNIPKWLQSEKMRTWISQYEEDLAIERDAVISLTELLSEDNLFSDNTINGLSIPMGTSEDGKLCNLRIGDEPVHVLVGGATGSGKSNLLHDIILNACWKYPPSELNLYLLDYKEGVEFNKYAIKEEVLPHAELIAKHADVGYGLTVLEHLIGEYTKRAELFKKAHVSNYAGYRKKYPNMYLPRIVLIVDEFQTLYQETIELEHLKDMMLQLAKKGRNGGVHMIFATQSLRGLTDFHDVKTQFMSRLVCKCSVEDCNDFLNYNNLAAAKITVPKAILNEQNGIPDYNCIFSVPLVKDEDIPKIVKKLCQICSQKHLPTASEHVFDGEEQPDLPKQFVKDGAFYLGQKTDYEESSFLFSFAKANDENLLIIGTNTRTILFNLLIAAENLDDIDYIDYIGDGIYDIPTEIYKFVAYTNLDEYFLENNMEDLKNSHHLIFIDHIAWERDKSYKEKKWSERAEVLPMLSKAGTHIVAIFDSVREWKRGWADKNLRSIFRHVIAYNMAPQDWEELVDIVDSKLSRKLARGKRFETRAIYAHEERAVTFKPFKPVGVDTQRT